MVNDNKLTEVQQCTALKELDFHLLKPIDH